MEQTHKNDWSSITKPAQFLIDLQEKLFNEKNQFPIKTLAFAKVNRSYRNQATIEIYNQNEKQLRVESK